MQKIRLFSLKRKIQKDNLYLKQQSKITTQMNKFEQFHLKSTLFFEKIFIKRSFCNILNLLLIIQGKWLVLFKLQIIKRSARLKMTNIFISIQGNIGSGKSTILKIIKENFPELVILDEPLASWEKVGENGSVNLLKLYYEQPKRWGFTFQIYAFMSRLKKWSEFSQLSSEQMKISERSLLSDRYIFASIMRDMDILSQLEHEAYLQCYKDLTKMRKIAKVQGVIYVQCDPKTCAERIKKRARQGQGEIPLDYLERLHDKHQQWLNPSSKMNGEQTQSSNSDGSEQQNIDQAQQVQEHKTQQVQVHEIGNHSTSITQQKVLIIDNTVPIDKNRVINSVKHWLKHFQTDK